MDQSSKVATVAALVRQLVHSGTLQAGDALPSTRSLAAELGVARGTVVAAYEQLDGEGYIRTRQGAAARVVSDVRVASSSPLGSTGPRGSADSRGSTDPHGSRDQPLATEGVGSRARFDQLKATRSRDRLRTTDHTRPTSAVSSRSPHGHAPNTDDARNSRAREVDEQSPLDLRPGIPAVTAFPTRDWRHAWRTAAALPLIAGVSDPVGTVVLREQIATLGLTRGFAADPSQVVVTAGTSEALSLLTDALRSLHQRTPRLVVEDPGYRSGRRAILGSGGEVLGVPVTEDGLDLDYLDEVSHERGTPDAVMVTPTHQYPLGSVMPVAHRRRLLEWAAANGVIVIEDDYDSEFRHRGVPMPALASLDDEGVVVHLGGFSKTLDPRLRCAYMVLPAARPGARPPASLPSRSGSRSGEGAPSASHSGRGAHVGDQSGPQPEPQLLDQDAADDVGTRFAAAIIQARAARGPVVSEVTQAALAQLMRTGALRRHLGRVRRDYVHRRDRIAARIDDAEIPGLEVRALAGGLHAVLMWPRPNGATEPMSATTPPNAGTERNAKTLPTVCTPLNAQTAQATKTERDAETPMPAKIEADAATVRARLAHRGILVEELARYAVTPETELNGLVLGYGAVSLTQLDRGLDTILDELSVRAT